jgi:hypothetical protein
MFIHISQLSALLDEIPDDTSCRPLNPDPMGFDAPSGKEWITWFIEMVKNLEPNNKESFVVEDYSGDAPKKISGGWKFNGEITQMITYKDDLYILTSRGEMYKLAELD